MPNGSEYNGIVEFKDVLLERRTQIARAFTSKLISYATGRRMEPADRPAIDVIVEELDRRGNGFYDLVELIVLSRTFQSI